MRLRAGRGLVLCVLVSTVGAYAVPQAAGVTAVTRYVVSTGDDTANDCTDSANPCAGLQHAIDQANTGDTIDVAGTIDSNVTIATSLTITQWPAQASAVLDGTHSGTVVTIDGGSASSALPVTLSDLTIENGASSDSGGGVLNDNGALTVDSATFSSNSAGFAGGGVVSGNGSTLTVEHSTFSNNSADWGGGAIADTATLTVEDSTFSGNSSGGGGGGAILELGSGTLLRSTLTGNTAGGDGAGGGVEVLVPPGGGPATPASLLAADSTFTDNSAVAGGAIVSNGSITVESSTFTGNSAAGGAAVASANLSVLFAADIFAKQASGSNCAFGADGGPPNGPVDAGYNVDDDGTCGLSSAKHSVSASRAIDHYLGSLADNGGPTQTVALLRTPKPRTSAADPALAVVPRSFHVPQAVDGKTAACSVPDQRGVTPTAGIHCDVGAYQTSPPSAPGALTGRIAHNSLRLSWRASHDNAGVDHYVVYLGNAPLRRVAGTRTEATVCLVCHRGEALSFTLRAFDADGNRSGAGDAVIVKPVPRPTSAPTKIPHWAWRLLAWQTRHVGSKPVTPQPLPDWYHAWQTWRKRLFRVAS